MKLVSFIAAEPELEGLRERGRTRAGVDAVGKLDEEEKQGMKLGLRKPKHELKKW